MRAVGSCIGHVAKQQCHLKNNCIVKVLRFKSIRLQQNDPNMKYDFLDKKEIVIKLPYITIKQ